MIYVFSKRESDGKPNKEPQLYDAHNPEDMDRFKADLASKLSDKMGRPSYAVIAGACQMLEQKGSGQVPVREPRPSDWKRCMMPDEYIAEMKKEAAKREAELIAEAAEDDGF